jgi:hypothetical protein
MPSAQAELVDRLVALEDCIGVPYVQDGTPKETKRNRIARMYRNGLAVTAFAITEAFLRDRVAELLNQFDNALLAFGDLSPKLQELVTIGALKGILFRCRFETTRPKHEFVLDHLPSVVSASTNLVNLSPFSFGNEGSNINHDDVSEIMSACGIKSPWEAVSDLTRRIGLGGTLDSLEAFKTLAKRRHTAAHDPVSALLYTDLAESKKLILSVCVPFDLLLSAAIYYYNCRDKRHANGAKWLTADYLRLRLVAKTAKGFAEQVQKPIPPIPKTPIVLKPPVPKTPTVLKPPVSFTTVKTHVKEIEAIKAARLKAKSSGDPIVVLDAKGLPAKWIPSS